MDIQGLMRQAQAMQKKMQAAQEELAKALYEGVSGGGMVKVSITGNGMAKKVFIDDSMIKIDEKDILEDLLVAAFNDAKKKVDDDSEKQMKSLTGGMPLPSGFKI
jgi:DNA-binding YbaB/EbfC family protein